MAASSVSVGIEREPVEQLGERRTRQMARGQAEHHEVSSTVGGEQLEGSPGERGIRQPEALVDRPVELQLAELLEDRDRVALPRREPELGPDPGPTHGSHRAGADRRACQLERVLLDSELEAARIPGEPQQARWVVDEAPVVEDPEQLGFEVLERIRRDCQFAGVGSAERQRDRVDGEVAAQ
jgi:hypothetical protein